MGLSDPPERPISKTLSLQQDEVISALRQHAFLSGLEGSQLEALARIAEPVQFGEQELVLSARQRSRDFYLVVSGSFSIELNNKHYAVRIQSLGPGHAFGWSALLEEHDTLFDVRSREHCTALRLEGDRLMNLLREDPPLAAEILGRTLHLVAGRVHATEARLGELCGVRMRVTGQRAADATIQSLNRLIEICLDGELGYRTAAQHLQSSALRIILTDHAFRRAQFAEELRVEVERLGGSPSNSGSLAASLHRSWIALKSAISGGSPEAIIAACETGEDSADASYQAAMNSGNLPAETRSMIEAQSRAVAQARDWLRQIHRELESGDCFRQAERPF